jgi:hypothetical protein
VALLLEEVLVSCSLAMDKHGGHEDLCDSNHRSVILYVHERTGIILLKHSMSEPTFSSRL